MERMDSRLDTLVHLLCTGKFGVFGGKQLDHNTWEGYFVRPDDVYYLFVQWNEHGHIHIVDWAVSYPEVILSNDPEYLAARKAAGLD